MRSIINACVVILLSGSTGQVGYAAPPTLSIPDEIEAKGDYVSLVPESNAATIAYIGLSGVDPFPSDLLKNQVTFILSVRGLNDGEYKFIAIAILKDEYTRKDFIVKVSKVTPVPPNPPEPPTPPIPPPTPKPDPKLDDAPVETNGLHVMFVYESGQRVTQNQFNILYGNLVGKYLNDNCDRINSQPDWRILDKDNVALADPWKTTLTRKRTNVPWVVIMSGKKYVYEGELTQTPDDFIKLLDKYKPKSRTDYCPNCPLQYRYVQTPLQK